MFQRLIRKILSYFHRELYPPLGRIPEAEFKSIAQRYSSLIVPRPSVSIVIPSFNCPDLLANCLNSIVYFSMHPKLEVIVIDNNSDAATLEVLAAFAIRPGFKIIYNQENRGFGPAINQGLELATGDYIILLNNDTIVTPFWIDRLLIHFRDRIGMIGPVTNTTGNIQKIITPKLDNLEAIVNFANKNFAANIGHLRATDDRLVFFCVALSRAAYREIGPLDEKFERGYFEDDDYCLRLKNAGWQLKIIQDVFVYHAGAASFSKLPDVEYRRIWNQNKTYFETKWGIKWTKPI